MAYIYQNIERLAETVNGTVLSAKKFKNFSGDFFIDSRKAPKNGLFVPLKGSNVDGHVFIENALKNGATGYFKEKSYPFDNSLDGFCIEVDNCEEALQKAAKYLRESLSVKILGITGTNGKTSTKEISAHILKNLGLNIYYSLKNLNNQIGVPLNILNLKEDHQFAVFEMGASRVGDIELLSSISKPDVSLITNVSPAHLEGFKTVENILKTKTEIFNHTKRCGIINIDNKYLKEFGELKNFNFNEKPLYSFGFSEEANLKILNISQHDLPNGYRISFKYNSKTYSLISYLSGVHNAFNLVASILSIHLLTDISMEKIVEASNEIDISIDGRMRKIEFENWTIIDDSYNANPASVQAGVDYFSKNIRENSFSILILGEMRELGDDSHLYHQKIGEFLNSYRFDDILLFGKETINITKTVSLTQKVNYFESINDLSEYLQQQIKKNGKSDIYIKGSRGNQLERVINFIMSKN